MFESWQRPHSENTLISTDYTERKKLKSSGNINFALDLLMIVALNISLKLDFNLHHWKRSCMYSFVCYISILTLLEIFNLVWSNCRPRVKINPASGNLIVKNVIDQLNYTNIFTLNSCAQKHLRVVMAFLFYL